MNSPASSPSTGVMRVARRRAKVGCEPAYEALVRGMFTAAHSLPGFLGAELIPPACEGGQYQVVMRFATQQDLDRWDVSDLRRLWHKRLAAVADGDPEYRLLTGLEAWFTQASAPVNHQPVRWKMACITWLGIFPTVSLLLAYVAPHLAVLPFLLRTALFTALVVLIMTWGVMPRLVPLFRHWLFKA